MKGLYYAKPEWPYSVASGGVVVRGVGESMECLLLFRDNDPVFKWHLPKGVVEEKDSLEQTAVREVSEEAGVEASILGYLGSQTNDYTVDDLHLVKTIHYFLMRYEQDSSAGMDDEHDGREWMRIDEAIKRLAGSPKNEGEIIERAASWFSVYG